jgi:uncharacterized membrane protein
MSEPAKHVAHSIDTVAALLAHTEDAVGSHQRRIERVTSIVGQPRSIYFALAGIAAWITANLLAPSLGVRPLDVPPFAWLQGAVGLAALVITTMVLTTQNRQTHRAEQRARLDLLVDLLSEQKAAKLIALLEELRRDLPSVRDRVDPVADGMSEAVDPAAALSALEKTEQSPASGN